MDSQAYFRQVKEALLHIGPGEWDVLLASVAQQMQEAHAIIRGERPMSLENRKVSAAIAKLQTLFEDPQFDQYCLLCERLLCPCPRCKEPPASLVIVSHAHTFTETQMTAAMPICRDCAPHTKEELVTPRLLALLTMQDVKAPTHQEPGHA